MQCFVYVRVHGARVCGQQRGWCTLCMCIVEVELTMGDQIHTRAHLHVHLQKQLAPMLRLHLSHFHVLRF